jgi:hypothetical protein
VTGYGLDDREVKFGVPVGSRIFSSPLISKKISGFSGAEYALAKTVIKK